MACAQVSDAVLIEIAELLLVGHIFLLMLPGGKFRGYVAWIFAASMDRRLMSTGFFLCVSVVTVRSLRHILGFLVVDFLRTEARDMRWLSGIALSKLR